MIMNIELIQALDELEENKGIPKEQLLDSLKAALKSAYGKSGHGPKKNAEIEINEDTGEVHVYSKKEVVEEVEKEIEEISLTEARERDSEVEIGDEIKIEVTPANFGRIAAQTAKQVVIQRIREAERDILYQEYMNQEGQIVTGTIQRSHKDNIIVDLDRTEALLIPREQIDHEEYNANEQIKVYIVEVEQTTKGPNILVSRTHPGLLKRLFEIEVPEIQDGTVEIKSVSREAGSRSKIAVSSNDPDVDPVGACVGMKGSRIHSIVRELQNENIDVINYTENMELYIQRALSPAKLSSMKIDEANKRVSVYLKPDQVSLAIGKGGQNIKLAGKLVGMEIDVFRELTGAEEEDVLIDEFNDVLEDWVIEELKKVGLDTAKRVLELGREELVRMTDLEEETIDEIFKIFSQEFEQ
jgi:N utilization substance protein A